MCLVLCVTILYSSFSFLNIIIIYCFVAVANIIASTLLYKRQGRVITDIIDTGAEIVGVERASN